MYSGRHLEYDLGLSQQLSQERGVVANALSVLDTKLACDSVVAEFGEELLRYVDSHQNMPLGLDWANTDFVYAQVLGRLIEANKILNGNGQGRLALRNMNPKVYELFLITYMDGHEDKSPLFDIDQATRDRYREHEHQLAQQPPVDPRLIIALLS